MKTTTSLTAMPDADLLAHVTQLAGAERHATVQLIAALAELDSRRLYLGQGCSSLFTYCTQVLHLSEHAAYGRIEAARAARRFPIVLERLADASLTLTALCLLAPHLTPDNCLTVIDAARHRTKREVEVLVAGLRPRPDAPTLVRRMPEPVRRTPMTPFEPPGPSSPVVPALTVKLDQPPTPAPTTRPAVLAPIAPQRYRVQFTATGETVQKLRQAQELLRHTIQNGDPAAIIDRALTVLLEHLLRSKAAATPTPRTGAARSSRSRHIPAAVRRAVWRRDGGQCAYVGRQGRCTERGFLEFHHVVPYAVGGDATVETIALRCRSHNQYEGLLEFPLEPPVPMPDRGAATI